MSQVLKSIAAAATIALLPCLAQAQISDNVVKIGVLTDLSGPASDATGQGSVAAAQMAVEDFGGKVAGVPVEVISANHQLKPDIGSEIATRWYDIEKVDLILDVPVSAVGLAVQEVARKKQKLFITHSTGTADFTAQDLSSFIVQAQASRAKIIGLASGPPDNINAIKLGGEFGVFAGGQQMAGLLILITDVHALGLKAAQGLLLTTSFYWDMDDQTRAWAKRFFARLNKMPTMWQAGVYSSVLHYLMAIQATGTDEALKVAAQMRKNPVEDFFSRHGRLREDGLMVHDLYLMQVKKPEESKQTWDYYQVLTIIPGEQAFPPPDPACALNKK